MNSKYSKYLNWFGRGLVLISLVFIFQKFWQFRDNLLETTSLKSVWLVLVGISILYGFLKFIHAYGWYFLLQINKKNVKKITTLDALIVFGKTHIAKYIPGNIFHYTSRHIFAKEHDLSDSYLLKTTFLEIFIVVSIASLFSLFSIPHAIKVLKPSIYFQDYRLILTICAIMVSFVVLVLVFRNYLIKKNFQKINFKILVQTYSLYSIFYCINFLFFIYILILISNQELIEIFKYFQLIGEYSIAWLLGFIIPGAPGGIGIREAVLLGLLSNKIDNSTLLLAIILFRIVTVTGDFLHFLSTITLERYREHLHLPS